MTDNTSGEHGNGTPFVSPLVSVVTPVFDGAEYLAECIESVLAQSYTNWEYTIVDNCSTDASLAIARAYAEKDARIRVVANERFLEQVPNFNMSLSLISEDSVYTKMVLADDSIFPRCLEEMVRVANSNPRIGIVGAYCCEEDRITCEGLAPPGEVFGGREICRRTMVEDLALFGSPNNLLFRSDIVRHHMPFYSETSLHEDTESCFDVLATHDWGFVHETLTFTRRENESLTMARRVFDPQHWLDKYLIVLKYGDEFLDSTECASCTERIESNYYRFLADSCMYRIEPGFWEYHHAGLSTTDTRLKRGKLALYLLGSVGRELAQPRRLGRRIVRFLSGGGSTLTSESKREDSRGIQ